MNEEINYLKHLKEVKKVIINKTRIAQSSYADIICTSNINNIEFIKEKMDSVNPNDTSDFEIFNTTSIGNLAFLSLYAPKEYAEKAEVTLKNYIQYIIKI